MIDRLDQICQQGNTAVTLVTGRSIQSLAGVFRPHCRLEVWGSYGWEHRSPDGRYTQLPTDPLLQSLLKLPGDLQKRFEALGGRVEQKPASCAAHVRGLPVLNEIAALQLVMMYWGSLGDRPQFEVRTFDGGAELRLKGSDKGEVVRKVLQRLGPNCAVAILGDDEEDELAFRAVQGCGVSALVRDRLRKTTADLWLQPPEGLFEFFDRWIHACKGRNS